MFSSSPLQPSSSPSNTSTILSYFRQLSLLQSSFTPTSFTLDHPLLLRPPFDHFHPLVHLQLHTLTFSVILLLSPSQKSPFCLQAVSILPLRQLNPVYLFSQDVALSSHSSESYHSRLNIYLATATSQ
jgi:hypothetical protein